MYRVGRGVTRSKRRALQWLRKAAENGHTPSCKLLARDVYADYPNAREVGHVGEGSRVATSSDLMEGHDVPPNVLTDVLYWLRKASMTGECNPFEELDGFRKEALEGSNYCHNEGCEVIGHRKDFKLCPQCKIARYCGDACQKQDCTTGGHKETCGTFAAHL